MAILPVSPQTATQGNPHNHSQGQSQPLALAGNDSGGSGGGNGGASGGVAGITGGVGVVGVSSQVNAVNSATVNVAATQQPQLLYQPYNLMPAETNSQGTHSPPTQRVYPTHAHRHRYHIYPHDGQQSDSLTDSVNSMSGE